MIKKSHLLKQFKPSDSVRVITYTVEEHADACKLFKSINDKIIFLYPITNDYVGVGFYSIKPLCIFDSLLTKPYINRLMDDNSVLFTTERAYRRYQDFLHLKESQNRYYGIPIDIPSFEIDNSTIDTQFSSKQIISILRTDFPLKSYIFGLIEDFKKLSKIYKELSLLIIASGDKLNLIKEAIADCKRIQLIDGCRYDELKNYFVSSFINVGHGTCVMDAAKYGVPSLVSLEFSNSNNTVGLYSCIKTITGKQNMEQTSYYDSIIKLLGFDINAYKQLCQCEYNTAKESSIDSFLNKLHETESDIIHKRVSYDSYYSVLFKKNIDGVIRKVFKPFKKLLGSRRDGDGR